MLMMSNEQIAERIGQGRRYLEEHGWQQGDLGLPDGGPVCALGAFRYTLRRELDREAYDETMLLARHLITVGGLGYVCDSDCASALAEWNDQWGRTEQEVIDLFAKGEKVALAGFDPDQGVTV